MEIRPFIGAEADEAELRQLHELYVTDAGRTFPGFPTQRFASFEASMRSRYGVAEQRRAWTAHEGDLLVGFGTAFYPDDADRHMSDWARVRVIVDAAHGRRGIGTALLRAIVADARALGRTMLANDQSRIGTDGEQTVGERWAHRVGFATVHRNRWQLLHVADVDPLLWDVPVPTGLRLVQWADAAPDELVAEFARARNAISDAPTGESAFGYPHWTVESVRKAEAEMRQTGDEMRYVVAVHEESGAVAALTGLLLDPDRLDLCWQRDTAVVDSFRGRGLGLAVKGAMMRWLLTDFPALQRVVTNNATDNVHMLRVNERLGYTHYADIGVFEASLERIDAALEMSAAIPGPRRESASEDEPVA